MSTSKEKFFHNTVLLKESVDGLMCTSGKVYVDCTMGGAGHSALIASKIKPNGILVCMDVDNVAIEQGQEKLKDFDNVYIEKSNYLWIDTILAKHSIEKVDGGILMDLGVSTYQLTSDQRGFSFQSESELDMRMDQELSTTAFDIVNSYSEAELRDIFFRFGEERFSKRIAASIIRARSDSKIETTSKLADIVKSSVPGFSRQKIHPATRVFQALRIAVNDELNILESALNKMLDLTEKGSRIAVITFHSLEDRIVKNFFKYWNQECICPVEMIECRCNHVKKLKIITKKPILPDKIELNQNPSSRSAKLRIAERM